VPHPSGSWAEPLPDEICSLVRFRLQTLGLFSADAPANQVLLNEYIDGEGIDPHKDGPLFDPLACIVSLGGDAVLNFYAPSSAPKEDKPLFSVVLRANSLVVFSGGAYLILTHGINSSETDAVTTSILNLAEARVTPGEVLLRPSRRLSLTLRRLSRVERSFALHDYIPPDIESERARRRAWWLSSISEK
jgi:alkylated DNA repair protein alkB family protein 6